MNNGFAIVRVLTAAAATLCVTGCGSLVHPGAVTIQDVQVRDGGRTLVLGLARCHGQPYTWRVAETGLSVTVTVVGSGSQGSAQGACSDLVQVPLTRALGDRRVFDLSSGHPVQVPIAAKAETSV